MDHKKFVQIWSFVNCPSIYPIFPLSSNTARLRKITMTYSSPPLCLVPFMAVIVWANSSLNPTRASLTGVKSLNVHPLPSQANMLSTTYLIIRLIHFTVALILFFLSMTLQIWSNFSKTTLSYVTLIMELVSHSFFVKMAPSPTEIGLTTNFSSSYPTNLAAIQLVLAVLLIMPPWDFLIL